MISSFLAGNAKKLAISKWIYNFVKRSRPRNVNKLTFCSIFDGPYHRDFPLIFSKLRGYFEDGLLNFVEKQTDNRMLYDYRDIDGFLVVTFLWIHPIYKNLCRTKWPHMGDNIDFRDNRFITGYMTQLH